MIYYKHNTSISNIWTMSNSSTSPHVLVHKNKSLANNNSILIFLSQEYSSFEADSDSCTGLDFGSSSVVALPVRERCVLHITFWKRLPDRWQVQSLWNGILSMRILERYGGITSVQNRCKLASISGVYPTIPSYRDACNLPMYGTTLGLCLNHENLVLL